ncbi:UDP-N-acetylmuramate:L-alanyl-gamma-D-glutamyl-meso-diaminopimelate ligase [Congregibacter litoralis]|uniref:UDP-N-acetylmuramate--L-alanyl-gamma-D-glutamyl-meso-2,6-diaminoheptandioate ligase n=1 Tax=Congregibacter litoralis KT71 TaxID=314285 RepID=A4AA11_9GAMM|nr:UDP-N-acetylmuramate:L-alanyl-gamma-D-glutamyl-meso-diaminopimelate ligase [Congregibacter litoralis]EAQ97328.1 UDP-N-acetylmuramate:L-alanyl-gamma-D-glutamyl-meso-diaminopimelate ligase [Congregibacter litoralis KT71]
MQQHLHILGICGTFMGGLALIARELGWEVSGCDANVYPPMSDQLAAAGITLHEGFDPQHLPDDALIVVGNALSRGNPAVEAVLDRGLPYLSGPQWLAEAVLADRWVLAVSGTHGKTTASSMLAWILEDAGLAPGFLIGGVPLNFGVSARLGDGNFFVIEADEYDTAFFDKRAKFVHYRPRTLVVNNLEFDHADIYPDLAAIQRQFHHLIRCIPGTGRVFTPAGIPAVEEMLELGCWTPRETLSVSGGNADWEASLDDPGASHWALAAPGGERLSVSWGQRGAHNVANALGACAAARHVGVTPAHAVEALERFAGVRRRLELRGEVGGVRVYDDFAHHPTAIASTLRAMKGAAGRQRVLAVIEPRSNTMRMGDHRAALAPSTVDADAVFWYQPRALGWSLDDVLAKSEVPATISEDIDELIARVVSESLPGDDVLVMSNGAFGGIHERLLSALADAPQLAS